MPANRFEHLHIDNVGPLPIVDGYMYLLTIIDRHTRFLQAIPVKSKSAEVTWQALMRGWFQFFGLPKLITTDRGKNFTSKYIKNLANMFGIHLIHTTSYHPASNGMIESQHHKLKNLLRALKDDDWIARLPLVILAWNNVIREDWLFSPNQLVFGTNVHLPNNFFEETDPKLSVENTELVQSYIREMQTLRSGETCQHQNRYSKVLSYDLATCKYVLERNESRTGLNQTYLGPFEVVERGENVYKIKRLNGSVDTVSISRLKPAYIGQN